MPDETKTPVIDWAKAKAHIHSVISAAWVNAGRVNHNPYTYLRDNVSALEQSVDDKKQRTPALFNAIMALPSTPDTRVDKSIPDIKK